MIRIGTPFHLRRHIREACWQHGILLPRNGFTKECQQNHIPSWMVGRFLLEAPDTTESTPAEIAKKIKIPEAFVNLMVHCLETSTVKRGEDD